MTALNVGYVFLLFQIVFLKNFQCYTKQIETFNFMKKIVTSSTPSSQRNNQNIILKFTLFFISISLT